MSDIRQHPSARGLLKAALLPLFLGVAIWFGAVLFEELVTADVRWGLWAAGTALVLSRLAVGGS